MARNDGVTVNKAEAKDLIKRLSKLPNVMTRKVMAQTSRRVQEGTVKPIVVNRIEPRKFDPPMWNAIRGVGPKRLSHTGPRGILKKAMASKGPAGHKRIKALKRSRTRVGYRLMSPTRAELGIPGDYPGYYPAFLEFRVSPIGNAPEPFMRGTYAGNKSKVVGDFTRIARERIRYHVIRGKK